ncbi:MAG: hypothetical protein RLZZ536_920 [Planctomycetota bacterium]|jgi:hypothetical protein
MSSGRPEMYPSPIWMRRVLLVAAVYNLVWGAWVIFFPLVPFRWMGIDPPNYPGLWQCIGMIVGVYGIGYGAAALDPVRHWPIVLVGLLGKIFGPIGFVGAAMKGEFPWSAGLTIITNDLIWWLPFGAILWHAWQQETGGRRRLAGSSGAGTATTADSPRAAVSQSVARTAVAVSVSMTEAGPLIQRLS